MIKEKLNKIIKLLTDKKYRFEVLNGIGYYHILPDKLFLKRAFKVYMNCDLNFKNPQTFNEKLQWLKLYDRRPEYRKMVDKYEVRKYIADTIGEKYLIPLLGGPWNSVEEIDFDALPEQFVLKCTHDSGGLVICRDKSKLNIEVAKRKLNKSYKCNFYWSGREWPYKYVQRKIIAEQYMKNKCCEGLITINFIVLMENQDFCMFQKVWKIIKLQRLVLSQWIGILLPSEGKLCFI